MPLAVKIVLGIVVSIMLVMTLAVGATTAAIYRSGTIAVNVQDPNGGTHVDIAVPAGLAHLALAMIPASAVPADAIDEVGPIATELERVWPATRSALRDLEKMPDFVMVEIEGRGDHIVVEKVGRKMVVLVETDGERVEVSFPLKTARRLCGKLGRLLDDV